MIGKIAFRALFNEELNNAIKEKKTLEIKKFFPEFRTADIYELIRLLNQMVSEYERNPHMMGF